MQGLLIPVVLVALYYGAKEILGKLLRTSLYSFGSAIDNYGIGIYVSDFIIVAIAVILASYVLGKVVPTSEQNNIPLKATILLAVVYYERVLILVSNLFSIQTLWSLMLIVVAEFIIFFLCSSIILGVKKFKKSK